MKQTQRDIKYIIKRILIGVGITIILFNLKKCNVYALTKIQISNNNVSKITDTTGKKKAGEYKDSLLDLEFYFDNNISFNYYYPIIYQYRNQNDLIFAISGITSIEDLSQENISLGSIGTTKDNAITSQYTVQYPPNLYLYDDNNTLICNVGSTCNSSNNAPFTAFNYMQYNFMVYNLTQDTVNSGMNSNIFGQYIYNNTNIDFYNSNVPFDLTMGTKDIDYTPPITDPLANYTKVDLTGHQAILIVPKNYSYLASEYGFDSDEPNANNPQIHYNIGYEKCIKPTLIEVNNLKNFSINTTLNSDPTSEYDLNSYCSDEPTLYTQNYPIHNIRSETQPAYFYMAILVYNNSKDYTENTPNWIETQQNPYGQAYVYVEEEYYNYYLVDDFSTFSQTLSYTDFELENQTTNINSLPTFNGLVDGSLSSVDTQWGQQMNYQYFLDFVKFPFNFLKSFITGTCEPITLPLPYLGNMQLPCMSTIYSQHVSSSLITLLSAIINGLIFWRCTLVNIVALQDLLQPEDTELEVWNL